MTYEITETLEDSETAEERALVQMIRLAKPHTTADFEKEEYVSVDTFRFETGWAQIDSDTRIEVTRLLQSCSSNHNHGVYYQAPRYMQLWEVMFAIGEVNPVADNEE